MQISRNSYRVWSKPQFAALVSDEAGVTSIEYALLGSLIAVVIVVAVAATGTSLAALWAEIANAVTNAM